MPLNLPIAFKTLSLEKIETSPEVQAWLSQFSELNRTSAQMMLSRLNFISRDMYSEWLKRAISTLPCEDSYALYSVRKIEDNPALWDDDGNIVSRSGESLGSEDLVYSLISNIVRAHPASMLDHPSLSVLRDKKIKNIVLVDDSIGSGDRVSSFINKMLYHPTFMSWWSLGLVKIQVISFARTRESESNITKNVRGSDHGKRKFRKSSKISFMSSFVYNATQPQHRWGADYSKIQELCNTEKRIPLWARSGYGKVLANIVFYHSVPNNIPGSIWYSNDRWNALFPGRTFPDWMLALLGSSTSSASQHPGRISETMLHLLSLIKRGVRSIKTISERLGCDVSFAKQLLGRAHQLGLITEQNRLTPEGVNRLKNAQPVKELQRWDYSLYIPSSWRTGQSPT